MHCKQLTLGYSPCPNDTFIFYALVHGLIPLRYIQLKEPRLEDVETLNRMAMSATLDVTKLSFHALGHTLNDYSLLRSGAALGRGCGPLLITSSQSKRSDVKTWSIALPGEMTTAALLLKLYCPQVRELHIMPFETILSAVAEGAVDGGVIIHESRFTYQQYGLECVQDLGQWWEETTGLPIPLGCIAAKRSLPLQDVHEIEQAIAASLQWAWRHPEKCNSYIKEYAQEMESDVVTSHINLYVNAFSEDLGEDGIAAVEELFQRASMAGLFHGYTGMKQELIRL
ncbi:1,4-dihydroxy-6-naphthoate synthase [Desulfogranum japonicum]|uniref:1,4-dihydroxy-6-naphthoate synthase n=1 Tax=Desulfogranum japonicum TaxID=231447 RepID=UPI0004113C31|nr:1,4-dihydroxy-6-naphthoate synthase [Desulfogranum japonicum]